MAQDDYLKYWRVIRYYTLKKYKLKTAELEMLLFLRSEKYFTKQKFKEFDELLPWRERRFEELLRDGWIEVFSKKKNHTHKTIYKLSLRSQRMMTNMYNQLSGEELSEEHYVNPIFKKKVKYTDKVYRNMIKKMNKITRQRQRPSQE